MIIYAVVDDNFGMMFNGRRQSQDKKLRKHILKECSGKTLWMNHYTLGQFQMPLPENVKAEEDFLDKAGEDECCFVENHAVAAYGKQITKMVLFKWNRVYPADVYLDVRPSEPEWRLEKVLEFEGNSHEKITKEEWIRVKEKE